MKKTTFISLVIALALGLTAVSCQKTASKADLKSTEVALDSTVSAAAATTDATAKTAVATTDSTVTAAVETADSTAAAAVPAAMKDSTVAK